MNKSSRFSPEVRKRPVRIVRERRGEYPSPWLAIESIAPKIGCMPPDVLTWVKRQPNSAMPACVKSPCIAISANAMAREIEEALTWGFDGYLTKPLSVSLC